MHRDYAQPGGHVAIAVFDDRVEIRSTGALPAGITADQLSGPHPSVLRNPLIAETFHRTGAVEVWGRGTNRVIEECRRYGVEVPTFEEQGGTVVVTFRAAVALGPQMTPQVTPHVTPQVTPQVLAVLKEARNAGSRNELLEAARLRDREHFRSAYLEPLLDAGWLEMTIPDKPRSSKQRYRTTEAGKRVLAEAEREE
jgi:ATP-dependent DNA helicase RecG